MQMLVTQSVLTWASVGVGVIAAIFWYLASAAEVYVGDPKSDGGFILGSNHPRSKKAGKNIDVYSTMTEGARLNRIAAILTAVAVLLQALASGAGMVAR